MTDNPHHALTGNDGRFEIRNVPPGSWTLRVWHETLGEQRIAVEVVPGRPADLGDVLCR